jgi:MoaA/NifB/PqqE/SkfB family radical SAM enzyme
MYHARELSVVHLEMTSRCNLACPQCARNDDGGFETAGLPLAELSLDDVRTIFPAALVAQLARVFLCGNYGDALVARDTLEALRYLRAGNASLALALHTNGSGRGEAWWIELARLGVEVQFGIDGLADTNHLYRRGADWAHVMRAVRAFVGAGGRAVWNFIVFAHNEHQVERARALSVELGFVGFVVKRTQRFASGERLAVVNRDGSFAYWLEEPRAAEWQGPLVTLGRNAPPLDTIPIACRAVATSSVYVSAEGLVFPCCHTAHLYTGGRRAQQLAELIAELPRGRADLDARRTLVADLVERVAIAADEGRAAMELRIAERVRELRADLQADETAVAQEIVRMASRSDISEEVERFRGHVAHWAALAAAAEPCGRKLDFLLQEMNREVNTMGSKADGLRVSELIIAAKAELEKLREQVQNVE